MAYVEIKKSVTGPRRKASPMSLDNVCVHIRNKKMKDGSYDKKIRLYIGKNIADELEIEKGDKIVFFYDDSNMHKWMISPSSNDNGFKLQEILQYQFSFTVDVPLRIPGFDKKLIEKFSESTSITHTRVKKNLHLVLV